MASGPGWLRTGSFANWRGKCFLIPLLLVFCWSIPALLVITLFSPGSKDQQSSSFFPQVAFASLGQEAEVRVNGRPLISGMKPYLAPSGRVFVPLRIIAEALGTGVHYHQGIVLLTRGEKRIELKEGLPGAWIDHKLICFDAPPQVVNGRFFVPLRFVSELLGAEVNWQGGGGIEVSFPGKPKKEIVLNFAGDTTLAWFFEEYVKDNYTYPFARLHWFKEADISMLNLENPITLRGSKVYKQFNFRMPPKYVQVLLDGGVDIVNLANNHVGDYGPQGILDTLSHLEAAGIKHVGAGENMASARRPVIFELKGKRVGFLGYFGGEDYAATNNRPGTSPCYEQYIIEDIKDLKKKADIVVVNFHWGVEKSPYPEGYQVNLAHKAIDAGADLIVGHHPHVLQGIEKYKDGVIVYSLGNFIFGGNSQRQHDTIVFQLIIKDCQLIPALIPVRVQNWQPYWLTGKEGRQIVESQLQYR